MPLDRALLDDVARGQGLVPGQCPRCGGESRKPGRGELCWGCAGWAAAGEPSPQEPAATPASGGGIHFRPSDEVLRDLPPEPDWSWQGVLVRGATTLFAGPPKVGGSTLLYALSEAMADGSEHFLGRRVAAGAVVYTSEESQATLAGTFPRRSNIHLVTRDSVWPKPTWADLVNAAAGKAGEVGAALVVLDTFSFWAGLKGDAEKDSGHVQPLLDALGEITRHGCAVALRHHHRKGGGEDGEAIRGSSAIVGAVDAFAEIERLRDAPSNQRQLVVTSRWPAPPVLVVEWNRGTGYRVVGEAASREEAAERSWPQRILDALPTEGDGATLDELESLLGGVDRRKWTKSLSRLRQEGLVERSGEGKKGAPYRHLALREIPSRDSVPGAGRKGTAKVDSVSVRRSNTDGIETNANSVDSPPRDGKDGNGPGYQEPVLEWSDLPATGDSAEAEAEEALKW